MLRIEKVNMETFRSIPEPCKCCLYWQTTGPFSEGTLKSETEAERQEWFREVVGEFGSCGCIAYFKDAPIGFAQYGPVKFFPRAKEYASGPLSEKSVFLACLFIPDEDMRGKGLGTAILKHVINDLKGRGIQAMETFARKSSNNNPSGPLRLYLKQSFRIMVDADDFPLVRLDF